MLGGRTSIFSMSSEELQYLKMIQDGLVGLCELKWDLSTINAYVKHILSRFDHLRY